LGDTDIMIVMVVVVVIIIIMGWDYISELWPPMSLLFISQVIYEHGEPLCMMLIGENSQFVHQNAIWQSYQQSHLLAN
jgi:hypothetical protein